MTKAKTTDEATIRQAVQILRSGRATMGEIAILAKTSRQLVAYWAHREGVDPVATRRDYLKRIWRS